MVCPCSVTGGDYLDNNRDCLFLSSSADRALQPDYFINMVKTWWIRLTTGRIARDFSRPDRHRGAKIKPHIPAGQRIEQGESRPFNGPTAAIGGQ